MSLLWLLSLNAGVLALMFIYFNRKIAKRLAEQALIERVRSEVGDIIVELNRTTERNVGLVEDRIRDLKETLDSADKRLVLIQREAEKREMSTQVYTHLQRRPVPRTEDQSKDRKTLPAEEILDLHHKGISSELIANKLGTTVGEVELVISLQTGRGKE